MKSSVVALCCATLLSGCSLFPADEGERPTSTSFVVTDRAQYDARLLTDDLDHVVFDVPFEIRNTTDGSLYRIGCHSAPPPILEKLVDGKWVTAYAPAVLLCLSPTFEIAAGEVLRETLHVDGYLPGQNVAPTFDTETQGQYRLQLRLFSSLTNEQSPLGRDLVPLEDRVSNTFEVE